MSHQSGDRREKAISCLRQKPIDGRDNVDGFAIKNNVSGRGECNQSDVVADDKVHFLCPGIGLVVINVPKIIRAAPEDLDVNHVFQSPADVLSCHRVLAVVLESRVNYMGLRVPDPVLALEGVLGENLDEECLAEIVRVFFAGLVDDAEEARHVVVVDFLTGVIDQVVCNLPESIDIADFEAPFDVILQDGAFAGRIGLGSDAGGINLMEGAVLGK